MKRIKKLAALLSAACMMTSAMGITAYAYDSDSDYDIIMEEEDWEDFFADWDWSWETQETIEFSESIRPSVTASVNGNHIKVSWDYIAGADYYKIYKYDNEKGKYVLLEKTYYTYYSDENVSSMSDYSYKIRAYKESGEKTKMSKPCNITTSLLSVEPNVYTKNKKIYVKWKKDHCADGYSVYYYKQKAPEDNEFYCTFGGGESYSENGRIDTDAKFKKLKSTESNSVSLTRNSEYNYYFKIRSYIIRDGKKIYSDYSDVISSSSSMALFNGAKGKSKSTLDVISYRSDIKPWTMTITNSDKKILDKFIEENFTDDMSPYEKAEYAAQYIHYIVDYAYGDDYSNISGLSCAAAVFEKHSGQCYQYNGALAELLAYMGYDIKLVSGYRGYDSNDRWSHYWCEITLDGVKYVVDAGNKKDGLYNFCLPYECTTKYLTEE